LKYYNFEYAKSVIGFKPVSVKNLKKRMQLGSPLPKGEQGRTVEIIAKPQ